MAHSTDVHRILTMHPGHARIGVSGKRTIPHPYCSSAHDPVDTIRVLLVSHPSDPTAAAALEAFEPKVRQRRRLECGRMDFELIGGLPYVDCMVLFAHGLHIVSVANFDLERVLEDAWIEDAAAVCSGEMSVSPATLGHPLLDRVGSFRNRSIPRRFGNMLDDAVCLLEGNIGGKSFPVAWARDYRGRVFRTLLGESEDFQSPDFVRLVLNAIEWAGG